jgi:hypothetical protein
MGKNKYKSMAWVFGILLVLVGGGFAANKMGLVEFGGGDTEQEALKSTVENLDKKVTKDIDCPDTLQTSGTITLKNEEDDTQDDTFDATGYLYKVIDGEEQYATSITDTTSGSVNLDCGQTYRLRLVSADGDEGDNAKINGVIVGKDASIVDNGRAVEFTPTGRSYDLKLMGERHGVLEFKAYDNVNGDWLCNSDDTCTDYEAEGTTFVGTDNSTMAFGTSDELDIVVHYRSTKRNTSFDDFGYLILIEAGTDVATKWQDPIVKLNGEVLSEATLRDNEAKQFQSYDFAYRVTNNDISDASNELEINWKPNSGQNPSTDIEIDFASIGAYLSVDGKSIGYEAAKDDTSATVVYAVQDWKLDIS